MMPDFFQFETDFVAALRCIPMPVRYKLDCCGVKLKLQHWQQFSLAERQALAAQPCETLDERAAYRQALQALVAGYAGEPAAELAIDPQPSWLEAAIPATVQVERRRWVWRSPRPSGPVWSRCSALPRSN